MSSDAARFEALLELVALQSVHGTSRVACREPEVQHLLDLAASGGLEEEVAASQLGSQHVDLVFRCGSSSAEADDADGRSGEAELEVELRLSLPPGYPSPGPCTEQQQQQQQPSAATSADRVPDAVSALLLPTAVRLCGASVVSSRAPGSSGPAGGRGWCDDLVAGLSRLVAEAAAEGRPCLHELWEHLQAAVDELAETQRRAAQAAVPGNACASPAGTQGARRGSDDDLQVLLLRLDHMHNRALYGRTIGGWIRELGLTGRLIFQGGLILILLEGDAGSLKEYLVRHRTESVDVDSRGRKCKERMMDVIVQQQPKSPQAVPLERGPVSGGGASPAAAERAFADFREVQVDTLDQVGQLLSLAGVGEWLRPAAGLP